MYQNLLLERLLPAPKFCKCIIWLDFSSVLEQLLQNIPSALFNVYKLVVVIPKQGLQRVQLKDLYLFFFLRNKISNNSTITYSRNNCVTASLVTCHLEQQNVIQTLFIYVLWQQHQKKWCHSLHTERMISLVHASKCFASGCGLINNTCPLPHRALTIAGWSTVRSWGVLPISISNVAITS